MDYNREDAINDMITAQQMEFLNKYQTILNSIKEAACKGKEELEITAIDSQTAWEICDGLCNRDFSVLVYDENHFVNINNIWDLSEIFKNDYRMLIRWGI